MAEGPEPLILASASPQRQAILAQLGVAFTVRVSGAPELEAGPPAEVAIENAYRKAVAVAEREPGATVLGVDTVVALGPRLYGKPRDHAHARATLSALAGRRHVVIGGVCLIEAGRTRTLAATTQVQFRSLSAEAVERYLDTGEWKGRAGAYAIQGRGALLIREIEGDYLNVVGLPVAALMELSPTLLQP
ncbi:MAG TPA: Maf family protein [Solirubrobacteraceae bacterium]|nr:Maf family protein [Solirubrobacteraceae bacterium]